MKSKNNIIPDIDQLSLENKELKTRVEKLQLELNQVRYEQNGEQQQGEVDKYRFIAENTTDVIWMLNPFTGRFTYMSPSVITLRGYSPEEVMSIPVDQTVLPEHRERLANGIQNMVTAFLNNGAESKITINELDQPCKDGSIIHTEITASCIYNQKGQIEIIGVTRNITERKLAENALLEARTILETTLASTEEVVFITDKEGKIIEFNDAFVTFHKFRNKEDCSQNLTDYPALFDVFSGTGVQLPLEQWPVSRAMRGETGKNEEFKILRKDMGETFFGNYSFAPILDKDGIIVGSVTTALDITERKKVEEAIIRRNAILSAEHETSVDGILVIDENQNIISYNTRFIEIMNVPKEIIDLGIDEPLLEHVTRQVVNPEKFVKRIQLLYENRDDISHEEIILKNGKVFERYSSPMYGTDNRYYGRVWYFHEITNRIKQEALITEANRKLSRAQRIAHIGSWEEYLPTGALTWSEEMFNVMGISKDTPLNHSNVVAVLPPEELSRYSTAIDRAINHNEPYSMDYHILRPDGSSRYIHDEGEILRDGNGVPEWMVGATQDITAQKVSQEILLQSERKYRNLFETMALGVLYRDSEGKIISANSSACKILGLTIEQMTGKEPLAPGWHAVDEEGGKIEFSDFPGMTVLKTKLRQTLVMGCYHPENKRYTWVNVTAAPDFQPGNDSTFQVFSTFDDITQLKESHAELNRINQHLEELVQERTNEILALSKIQKAILDSVPDIFFRIDKNGMFLSCHTRDTLHFNPEKFVNRKLTDVLPENIASLTLLAIEMALITHDTHSFEYDMILEGVIHNFEDRILAISDNEVLSIVRDVSEQKILEKNLIKTLEQEKELNDLKSRFVSMASHEFRTPLATILLTGENLLNYWLKMDKEKINSKLSAIIEQVEHLTDIVTNVMQVSKIQEGKLNFEPRKMDLVSLCSNVIRGFNSNTELNPKILFKSEFDKLELFIDNLLIQQALNNLVSNAVKYSPGNQKVHVRLSKENEEIILSVEDKGIGIPEVDQKQLFQPFYRATNVEQIQGNGLGLNIVRETIRMHGGEITFKSQEGKGTVFTIHFPAELLVK
jgi:PAS domain S-box-containing protein